jgi:hypothetical protein
MFGELQLSIGKAAKWELAKRAPVTSIETDDYGASTAQIF